MPRMLRVLMARSKRSSILITLIRCGETTWDAQGRIHGSTDLPLSDAGRSALVAHVHAHGPVRTQIIHHPPDEAATDTAKLLAPVGAKRREHPELADPNLGLLEGLTRQEFAERFRSRYKQWEDEPILLTPPEGEEMIEAADRLFHAVSKILRRSRSEEIAIILHDLGWAMLRCWIADRPLSAMREMMDERPITEHIVIPLSMLDNLEQAAKALTPQ